MKVCIEFSSLTSTKWNNIDYDIIIIIVFFLISVNCNIVMDCFVSQWETISLNNQPNQRKNKENVSTESNDRCLPWEQRCCQLYTTLPIPFPWKFLAFGAQVFSLFFFNLKYLYL